MGLLNHNPRVQFVQSSPVIQNYTDLKVLTSAPHKLNSVAAMFAFDLNFNYQLGSKNIMQHAHYLFSVRQPEPVLNILVSQVGYSEQGAAMYYCYRLRRICEIAKRVNHGMLLTYDNIQNGEYVVPIKSFLSLRDDVLYDYNIFNHLKTTSNTIKKDTLAWCQDCYERHLFFLKSLPLIKINH